MLWRRGYQCQPWWGCHLVLLHVCVRCVVVVSHESDREGQCLWNLCAFRDKSGFVKDQGVHLAVGFRVEVVYRQQGVTTISEEQSLAMEGAIGSSDA